VFLALCFIIVGIFLVGSVTLGILSFIYWFFKHWLWWVVIGGILLLVAH